MGYEIEHKYTVHEDLLPPLEDGTKIIQGYLPQAPYSHAVTRIRIYGTAAYLTIKGANKGPLRQEYEYEIPLADANELIKLCDETLIEKTRYLIDHHDHTWEIDIFENDNKGLVVAEIEFKSLGETFDIPDWADENVTDDERYYNSNLINNPYSKWNG